MNPELIALLGRLVLAHEKLADGVGRIADSLHYTEGMGAKINLATEIASGLSQIANAIPSAEEIADANKPPEE